MASDRVFKYYTSARFHDLLSTEGHFPLLVLDLRRLSAAVDCVSMLIHRLVTAVARITSRRFPKIRVSSSELNIFSCFVLEVLRSEDTKREKDTEMEAAGCSWDEHVKQYWKAYVAHLLWRNPLRAYVIWHEKFWRACGNVWTSIATRVTLAL